MKHLLISLIGLLSIVFPADAQFDTIRYFESYFETTADRQQWSNIPSDVSKNWIFDSKGGYIDEGLNYNPDYAYEGLYNAFHVYSTIGDPDIRKMVSRPLDLSDAKKPELSFAHAMFESMSGTNKLAVLFKAGSTALWDTIFTYNTKIDEWTTHSFNIASKYLVKDFQLAFESKARGEFGVCIDSVIIEEKDVIKRYVKSLKIRSVAQDPIPSGVSDIPVIRVDVNVVGNSDSLVFNSVVFSSISAHDSLFALNGFELVATKDSSYRPRTKTASLKIGSPVSIVNGKITFSNLGYHLTTGYNALWLVTDVKSTAPHNSIADFKIGVGQINISGSTYPSSEVSPAGSNMIEQSVFFDSFEGISTWTLESDFETAVPKGFAADNSEDPDFAYSGTRVLGTDVTVDGRYRINIDDSNAYYATTPTINLQYYTDVKLNFKKWIAFEGNDQGVIEVSINNGTTWQTIWDSRSDALTPDYEWVNYTLSTEFNAIVAHQPAVKVRFGVIVSNAIYAYAGFNIDNFAVTGNYLTNDVGLVGVITPIDDCHNPGMDSVKIVVHNYADRATTSSVPVFFSIDGSIENRVLEYIPGPIPSDGTITYTFTHTADFPNPGDFNGFTVKLQAAGDEDPTNDTKINPVFIQRSVDPPDLESFEIDAGYWKSYGTNSTWLCKVPEGSIQPIAGKSWILSPFGNYITNDTSYLEGSCYNLISPDRMILEMQLWMDSEAGKDGASLEYSADNGFTWFVVPFHEFSWSGNWYNGVVAALGTQGWSGINTNNWIVSKQVLPAGLQDEPKVKFRIKWASDGVNSYRGMAVDEIKVYAAPPDIGISKIDSFANRCQGLNPEEVTVTIKNLGINSLKQNDTIIVGFDFNQTQITRDTFRLAADLLPGESVKHTFAQGVDVSSPGIYNLTAYTLIEDDPWYYEGNNDTVSLDFTVYPGPITSLFDTIQTHLPDTVVLETIYNANYDYWWNGTGGSSTYNVSDAGWQYLKVTATRGNGCTAYDSTNVELLFYDVGTASLVHPVNNCGFSNHEFPLVRIQNFGTDSIVAGQKIAVFYSLNSGTPVSDTLILSKTLHAGKTADFSFTNGAIDLSGAGIYNFKIYTSYGGDTIAYNDTITSSIEILGRPSVSLGPDITVQALSHTLDAGSGYESYLWDNGATTRTREVTESGSYWVQVFDVNQCDNFDTAIIRLKIRDVSPGAFESPVSDCRLDTGEPVTLRIVNTGTDTVPAGTTVSLSYRFQEGARVNDNMILSQQIIPGAYVVFIFPGEISLDHTGDYSLEATAVISGDLRRDNDTSLVTIYRYTKPVVDFGLDKTEFIEDVSLTIDAGYSPFYSYDWQDTTTTHLYTVTADGLYYVTATDIRTLCYDRDTVRVYLIYGDVGVTWSDMPGNGCTGEFEHSKVRVTNLGPSVIGSSAPIYIACDVNGVRATVDTLVRTGNFNPGASLEMNLSGKLTITNGGDSRVTFYTLYDDDKKPVNDTLTIMFEALPAPAVNFGDINGSLNVELPHQLDAGTGHKSYLWQDNSTTQTYMVNANGIYSVTVTGQNDCQTFKSVRINMPSGTNNVSSIGKINLYPNPNNGLFNVSFEGASKDVVVRIFNNQGQTVYIREFNSELFSEIPIDVQELSRGMYHMIIQDDHKTWQGKFIIQ